MNCPLICLLMQLKLSGTHRLAHRAGYVFQGDFEVPGTNIYSARAMSWKLTSKTSLLFQFVKAMTAFALSASLLVLSLSFVPTKASNPIQDCPACWCKSAGDCPDPKYACPPTTNCKTAVVKDKCGCCDVCLKAIGEPCRREPFEKQDEMCDRGLACMKSDDEWYCASMEPDNFKVSRCEKGL